MNNLTKIASLPGSGGGCMSALPAEVNEQPVKVQMKAQYFNDEGPMAYVPSLGCFVPAVWPPIEPPPTIEELGRKYLDAHEGLGC